MTSLAATLFAGIEIMAPIFEDRECDDEELRREAIDERRARHRASHCQCGNDLPGHCPGPASCPYSDFNQADDDEGEP